MNIVVPPTILPRVEGMKPRYRVGDTLKATCTSKNSKPAANLTWGLNGNILDSEYIKKFSVKIEPETNLETATSTLSLELQRHHFSASGRLKLKCTASIHNIYWRTSENSAEEERPKAAVVAAQDYRLHDVFRKPIDLYYTTPVPSNCAASMKLYILPVSGISNYLIKNAIFLSLFLFNYCYFY